MRRTLFVIFVAVALLATAAPTTAQESDVPTVTVLAPFGGSEADAFQAELAAYGADTGIEIVYEQYSGDTGELIDRLSSATPPDLVVSPQPGTIIELAPWFLDMSTFVNPKILRRDFSNYLIDQVTLDDVVLGAPIKMDLKSIVWYSPREFEAHGYAIPTSFTELVALSDAMVADGQTPWCNFIESSFATGWMGTDWVEDLLLGADGPTVYDAWVNHDVVFDDPRIERAFERYQLMIDTPGYVYNRSLMLDVPFFANAEALGAGDCLMHKQATFFAFFVQDLGLDIDDFATFEFPTVDPSFGDASMGGGDYVAAVDDRNVTRQLVRYLVSHRFGRAALADADGWLLPNVKFDSRRYTDDLTRAHAVQVRAAILADQFRFDASDLMPPEVGAGTFWSGITDLVAGSKSIPQVLVEIDNSWPS